MKYIDRLPRQTALPRPSVSSPYPIQYTICFLFVNADPAAAESSAESAADAVRLGEGGGA